MAFAWMDLVPYLGSFIVTLADAIVKTFQTRNIAVGNESAARWTSWLVSTTWIANINFAVMGGFGVVISAGFGGMIGVTCAMRLHKRIFN